MELSIKGLSETVESLNRVQDGIGNEGPAQKASQLLQRAARDNAPVDTGALRSSITASVRSSGDSVEGVISSNLKYAPAQELGTRPHFPPVAALEGWALRHGFASAFLVARAIARRGTKGKYFMKQALEDNERRVIELFNDYYNRLTGD